MRPVYFIRHASPTIQPNVPAEEWTLSERGVEEARRLAQVAATWGLAAVYSSAEPKAQATALIVGDAAALPVHVVEGLQELRFDRWIPNADEFSEMIRRIFEQPAGSVHGAERVDAAAARFASAIELLDEREFPAAIVSHGRILTAYLAQLLRLDDPFTLWRSIPMPGWVRVNLDDPRGPVVFEAAPPHEAAS